MKIKVKLHVLLLTGLLYFVSGAYSASRISVITIGPGEELYTAFGHTALRIYDQDRNLDVICNFGAFDFHTPHFYTLFLKGQLDYYLDIEDYKDFYDYAVNERRVHEQLLDLSNQQKEKIIHQIQYLYRPENRAYKYKFISDNCTTAIRDIILPQLYGNRAYLNAVAPHTYRYYLNLCLIDRPWTRLGINLILGSKIDENMTNYQSMFLPDQLYEQLKVLKNNNKNLVEQEREIGIQTGALKLTRHNQNHLPLLMFIVLAMVIVFMRSKVLNSFFLFIIGIIGSVILFLLLYSGHIEFQSNYNILWCNPLLLLYGYAINKQKLKLIFWLSLLNILNITVVLFSGIMSLQEFESSFIVLMIIILYISFIELVHNKYNHGLRFQRKSRI